MFHFFKSNISTSNLCVFTYLLTVSTYFFIYKILQNNLLIMLKVTTCQVPRDKM